MVHFSLATSMLIRITVVVMVIMCEQASILGIDQDIRLPPAVAEGAYKVTTPNEKAFRTFAQLMARRENIFAKRRQKHRKAFAYPKSENGAARGHGTAEGRILLSNERGLERSSVILVPIDQPKVLTGETFVTGQSQRVQGETQSAAGGKNEAVERRPIGDGSSPFDPSILAEQFTVKKRVQIATDKHTKALHRREEATNTVSNEPIIRFPAEYWQLPPALLAARLQRFSRADIMRGLRHSAKRADIDGDKLRALIRLLRRDNGRNHQHYQMNSSRKNYGPSMSFLIDDDSFHRTFDIVGEKPPANKPPFVVEKTVHNKLSKSHDRESAKLITAEESDMDLLNPTASSGGAKLKQYRKLYETEKLPKHGKQQQHSLPFQAQPFTQLQPLPTPANVVPIVPSHGVPTVLSSRSPLPQANKPLQLPIAVTVLPPPLATVSSAVTTVAATSQLTPNAKFELCCHKQQLPSTCQQFCNFDTFTQEKLLIALLGTHCPSAQLSKAFDCATSKVDHSECCRREGIDLIHNGQCMVFCRTHIKTPPNVSGYVSCLSVFGTIKNCYRDHQRQHKNLFGD